MLRLRLIIKGKLPVLRLVSLQYVKFNKVFFYKISRRYVKPMSSILVI